MGAHENLHPDQFAHWPQQASLGEVHKLVPGSEHGMFHDDLPDPDRLLELRHVPMHQVNSHEDRMEDNPEGVNSYRQPMREGKMPPAVAMEDKRTAGEVWLYDGTHRHAAAQAEGLTHLPTYVYPAQPGDKYNWEKR